MTIFTLRSLIRETFLTEEVYGAQATVYHGTKADPQKLVSALLNDEFRPGEGAGSMYGKGLYTVYDLTNTKTSEGDYGDNVIKMKVNLYGYIIFDPDIALKVYKKPLTPAEQAEEIGYSDDIIKALRNAKPPRDRTFTSKLALSVSDLLQHEVKGLVFTGENDGRVAVVYDPTTAVPMAWKQVSKYGRPVNSSWTSVNRTSLLEPVDRPDVSAREGRPVQQSTIRRSALGDFEAGKWSPLTLLKRLKSLPEDQRVIKGNLILVSAPITSLPAGLKVDGDLDLSRSSIASLPAGLKVIGSLNLFSTSITSLPAGLQVSGALNISNTSVASLPADLKVGAGLNITFTRIASLPAGLKVGGDLDISKTSITSLPADLKVGGSLYLYSTSVTSLPPDLKVGSYILGLDRKYWANVPQHLKGKIG